jgi:hypothetical protein
VSTTSAIEGKPGDWCGFERRPLLQAGKTGDVRNCLFTWL